MLKPTKRNKQEVDQAKAALGVDATYRYSLLINKKLMLDYIAMCRKKNTDAAKSITAFIERQLAANDC